MLVSVVWSSLWSTTVISKLGPPQARMLSTVSTTALPRFRVHTTTLMAGQVRSVDCMMCRCGLTPPQNTVCGRGVKFVRAGDLPGNKAVPPRLQDRETRATLEFLAQIAGELEKAKQESMMQVGRAAAAQRRCLDRARAWKLLTWGSSS